MTLAELAAERFDLLVIGGGIHGAFAAWDAATRGLRVALIEGEDFGAATSANSLKVLHGGFRYLQRLDVARLRASSAERWRLARMAPHLVAPLGCVAPTRRRLARSRPAFHAAALLYSAATAGRPGARAPDDFADAPRVLRGREYRELTGDFAVPDATGGVLWWDHRLESPDRFLLGVVRAARASGALVANYLEAVRLVRGSRGEVEGAEVRDEAGGDARIAARVVLLAANAGNARLAPEHRPRVGDAPPSDSPPFALACNLVLDRVPPEVAVAFPSVARSRLLFAVPWRGRTIVGTSQHAGAGGDVREAAHRAALDLLRELNASLPGIAVAERDVALVHHGLLPGTPDRLLDEPVILDHSARDRVNGVVSMTGVKWTTARRTAERAVAVCLAQLGVTPAGGGTQSGILPSVGYPSARALFDEPVDGAVDAEVAGRLKLLYGSEYREVLALAALSPPLAERIPGTLTIGAQIVYAIRHEMARHLDDIVLRRTELGSAGHPGDSAVAAAARIAAAEVGWTEQQTAAEVRRVTTRFPRFS